MKTNLYILVILFLSINLQGQKSLIDSLVKVLDKTDSVVVKIELLNKLSDAHKTIDPDEVIFYGKRALRLAKDNNSIIEEGKAYHNLGNGSIIKGNYNDGLQFFYKARNTFEKLPLNNTVNYNLARAYGSIGIIYSEQSNYHKAFTFYSKAISINELLNDEKMLSKLYNNVAVAYRANGDVEDALKYFFKAKTIQNKYNDRQTGITITNIAKCYLIQNNFNDAIEYFNSAKEYLQNDPRALGEYYNSLGTYYEKTNDPSLAIQYWDRALGEFKKINDKFGRADSYIFKGKLLLKNGNYKGAIGNANASLELANQTQVLEQIIEGEKILSEGFEKLKYFKKSLHHMQNFHRLQDSLTNATAIKKSVEAQMNFERELQENSRVEEHEKKELLRAQKDKQFKTKILIIALTTLFLFGFGFLYYSRVQLKKNLTLQKELTEYEQKALHLQMNPHFIFNCLGAISGFIIQNGTDHAIKYLAKFSKLMRLTLEYSKESLIPVEKEVDSLRNYLELEKLRFNNEFDFEINKDINIEDAVALPPLLIQPLVENAIIHGILPRKNDGHIKVNFSLLNEELICEIIDNGVGIDASLKMKENTMQIHKSMALDIIKKRLSMITKLTDKNASIDCDEILDGKNNVKGTKITISLPVQYID